MDDPHIPAISLARRAPTNPAPLDGDQNSRRRIRTAARPSIPSPARRQRAGDQLAGNALPFERLRNLRVREDQCAIAPFIGRNSRATIDLEFIAALAFIIADVLVSAIVGSSFFRVICIGDFRRAGR